MAEGSDAELVTQAKAGDRDAWSLLCRRHAPRLASYLGARLRRPPVVDKLVEEAIVLAFKHLDEIGGDETFAAWFRRVGAHLALRWYKEHRDEPLSEPFPAERCGSDPARVARLARLETALAALSDAQRMAIEQRHRAGLAGDELAEVLHVEPAKAERLVDEAMMALERAWEREPA
jgi:RNA polymerase sigma-70 factor (ECF subfamily)